MKILLLSAHTDDVELGLGGTLSRYVRTDKDPNIKWVAFSSPRGVTDREAKVEFDASISCIRKVGKDGLKLNYTMDTFPVRNFGNHRQEILDVLTKIKQDFHPTIVFGPATTDVHQDHSVLSEEMIRCFKSSSTILGYEMPWNQLTSNSSVYVKLTKQNMIDKVNMLKCYQSQMKDRLFFNEDVIFGQGKINGAVINSDYAEKFECIRMIQ